MFSTCLDWRHLLRLHKLELKVAALTKALEEKMTRVGELAVEIVQMKNDAGDTADALSEDKKFLADMQKNCDKKAAEWETIVKTRNEELLALADTIKVLSWLFWGSFLKPRPSCF